jgi:hypothetical protein
MVRGRWGQVWCVIVARYPAHEATSVCRGVFAAPGKPPRRVTARFSLSGTGVLNPDCSIGWRTNPYCTGKNRYVAMRD